MMVSKYIPKWTSIRGIGNSRISKISILMPFFGYIILYNNYVSSFFKETFSITTLGGSELPLNYGGVLFNISCLYLGSFLFGIASILYQIFCDKDVKEYSSENDFAAYRMGVYTPHDLRICCQYIEKNAKHKEGPINTVKLVGKALENKALSSINDIAKLTVYKEYYNAVNISAAFFRATCFILYSIGIVFVSIPAIRSCYKVLAAILF